jgi:flagellar biosynthetic protein FliR
MIDTGLLLQFQVFLLVFARIFGMMVLAPFFSSMAIPFRFRATLALFVTLIMVTLVLKIPVRPEISIVHYILQLAGELLVGMAIGFLVGVFFTSISFAAELFSMQMGLSITNVFDPQAQIEVPVLGQMLSMFGILVFISVGGHHHLLNGIWTSYSSLPVLEVSRHAGPLAQGASAAFTGMFGIAIKIALPMIGVSFLLSVSLGILAKTAPQLNILMLGFPLQIMVGLLVLMASLPFIFRFVANVISQSIVFAMRVMGAGA